LDIRCQPLQATFKLLIRALLNVAKRLTDLVRFRFNVIEPEYLDGRGFSPHTRKATPEQSLPQDFDVCAGEREGRFEDLPKLWSLRITKSGV
jgi:hypothetical protein